MHIIKNSFIQIDEDFGKQLFPNKQRAKCSSTFKIYLVTKLHGNWIFSSIVADSVLANDKGLDNLTLKFRTDQNEKIIKSAFFSKKFVKLTKWGLCFFVFIKNNFFQNANGIFNPIIPESIFVLKTLKRNRLEIQSTISHEHIHLLQEKNLDLGYNKVNISFIKEQYKSNQKAKYLLSRFEFEARLHELLIMHFHNFNTLPDNYFDLMSFINDSPLIHILKTDIWLELDEYLDDKPTSKLNDIKLELNQLAEKYIFSLPSSINYYDSIISNYRIRNKSTMSDLSEAIQFLDLDHKIRFINEVIPIMYCNLIHYYGYGELSSNISKSISRPNLYDLIFVQ